MTLKSAKPKTFIMKNATLEKFIQFKKTFGVIEKIPNYTAEIEYIDENNFKRKVKTDMGFKGIMRNIVEKLVGATSIDAVENITYDLTKKQYECKIGDPNEGKYKNFFSFTEIYTLVEENMTLKGTVTAFIDNNLPYMLDKAIEDSFFSQRYSKLKDELMASKIDPNSLDQVIEDELTKSIDELNNTWEKDLSEMPNLTDLYNNTYYYEDDDIPIC